MWKMCLQKHKQWSTKHYTYTKTQTMINKTLHIHKNTNNDLQNTTHTQKHKQWSTKHYTYTETQTMIYKTPHIHKNTNNDLQNTTHTQ
jgi:hypothetical protein